MNAEVEKKTGFLKYVVMTIFQGFLLGIGICIVFAGYQMMTMRTAESDLHEALSATGVAREELVSEKDSRLQDLRKIEENGSVWIVGRISNLRADRPLPGFELQANLFKGDQSVDQYSESMYGGMRPAEVRLFKISCGCKGNPPAAHDRFEVRVVPSF